MKLESHSIPIDITLLQPRDHVLVLSQSGHTVLRGEIDDVAPQHHLVWIRDELSGERKIVMGGEHQLRLATKPNFVPTAPKVMPPNQQPLPTPTAGNDHNSGIRTARKLE